jgi:hypothetical protein
VIQKRQFHIGEVLSVITGRTLSPQWNRTNGILCFMTGEARVLVPYLPIIMEECKNSLIQQFPQFASLEIVRAIEVLASLVKEEESDAANQAIVDRWISEMISGHYGVRCEKMLTVKALAPGIHRVIVPEWRD